jgi:hypothetical protein
MELWMTNNLFDGWLDVWLLPRSISGITSSMSQSRESRYFQHLTLALLEIRMARKEISVTDTLSAHLEMI